MKGHTLLGIAEYAIQIPRCHAPALFQITTLQMTWNNSGMHFLRWLNVWSLFTGAMPQACFKWCMFQDCCGILAVSLHAIIECNIHTPSHALAWHQKEILCKSAQNHSIVFLGILPQSCITSMVSVMQLSKSQVQISLFEEFYMRSEPWASIIGGGFHCNNFNSTVPHLQSLGKGSSPESCKSWVLSCHGSKTITCVSGEKTHVPWLQSGNSIRARTALIAHSCTVRIHNHCRHFASGHGYHPRSLAVAMMPKISAFTPADLHKQKLHGVQRAVPCSGQYLMDSFLATPEAFKQLQTSLMKQVEVLDPDWAATLEMPQSRVPIVDEGTSLTIVASPWQLVVDIAKYFKGKSNDTVILKHCKDFLESGCDFKSYPMQLHFLEPPNTSIEPLSVVPKNGLGRSHALKLIFISIDQAALTQHELKLILPAIKTFFTITGVVSTTGNLKEDAFKALRDKMGIAGSQTPSLAYSLAYCSVIMS